MMMAAFPDCVRKDKVPEAFGPKDVESPTTQPLLIWKSFKDLTPSGVMGDARRASAEKGEMLLNIAAKLLADELIAGAPWE
jgi:creatinine amidohydrolase